MLVEKRQNEILRIVEEYKSITVIELTRMLNASESTIRRDLTEMDKQGLLVKVHGGATTLNLNYRTKDYDVASRKHMNMDEKLEIVKYAATLITHEDFVYIDAGTTTELMIDYITEKNAVFVTNGTVHARKLAERGCNTYILGGQMKFATEAVIGNEAIEGLRKYNFTKGFFGTNGVSKSKGFTTPDIDEAMVKQMAVRQCKDCYILCDRSKFEQISPVTFAGFDEAKIITYMLNDDRYMGCNNILEVG